MISLKGDDGLARMRVAGRAVSEALAAMAAHVAPGIATSELDDIAREVFAAHDATPSFLGYPAARTGVSPFPAAVTVSVNEEIVHGIPGARRLSEGDIVSIDCGCIWRNYHADAAVTVPVGEVPSEVRALIDVSRDALMAGISALQPGNRLWDAIRAVQGHVEEKGFAVVREYQGHGIGRNMHEPPSVPNFLGEPRPPNIRLRPGLTIAMEPMVTAGDWRTTTLEDGWTVVTSDNSLSSHFEHTIAVTKDGAEILTLQEAAS
jgi:methionyl aminopeptidase